MAVTTRAMRWVLPFAFCAIACSGGAQLGSTCSRTSDCVAGLVCEANTRKCVQCSSAAACNSIEGPSPTGPSNPASLGALTVTPSNPFVGEHIQLAVTPAAPVGTTWALSKRPSDAADQALPPGETTTWTPAIAGAYTVTATANGVSATADITVAAGQVAALLKMNAAVDGQTEGYFLVSTDKKLRAVTAASTTTDNTYGTLSIDGRILYVQPSLTAPLYSLQSAEPATAATALFDTSAIVVPGGASCQLGDDPLVARGVGDCSQPIFNLHRASGNSRVALQLSKRALSTVVSYDQPDVGGPIYVLDANLTAPPFGARLAVLEAGQSVDGNRVYDLALSADGTRLGVSRRTYVATGRYNTSLAIVRNLLASDPARVEDEVTTPGLSQIDARSPTPLGDGRVLFMQRTETASNNLVLPDTQHNWDLRIIRTDGGVTEFDLGSLASGYSEVSGESLHDLTQVKTYCQTHGNKASAMLDGDVRLSPDGTKAIAWASGYLFDDCSLIGAGGPYSGATKASLRLWLVDLASNTATPLPLDAALGLPVTLSDGVTTPQIYHVDFVAAGRQIVFSYGSVGGFSGLAEHQVWRVNLDGSEVARLVRAGDALNGVTTERVVTY